MTYEERRREERLEHYRVHRNRIGEQLLRAVLRMSATVDAAQTVNNVLEDKLGLLDLSIDVTEVIESATVILRSEVMSILAREAYMPRSVKYELADRLVARLVPRRDNIVAAIRKPPVPEVSRHEDLSGALMREIRKISKKGR